MPDSALIPAAFFATADMTGEYDYRVFATRAEAESHLRDYLEEGDSEPEIVEFRRVPHA